MKRILSLLCVMLIWHSACLAAIDATTRWNIRTDGADTNGGGYSTGGVNMSLYANKNAAACTGCQSAVANISTTDAAITQGSTTLTSATAAFTSDINGNTIYLTLGGGSCTGGTVSTQWRTATYSNATTITLDSAPAGMTAGQSCSGVSMNIGGGLATIGAVQSTYVAGNSFDVKAGTYTKTTSHMAFSTAGTASAPLLVQGYNSTPGDGGTKPVFTSGTNSINLFTMAASGYITFRNLSLTHTAATRGGCIYVSSDTNTPITIDNVTIDGCGTCIGSTNQAVGNLTVSNSLVKNCTVNAANTNAGSASTLLTDSVFLNNTGAGLRGTGGAWNLTVENCVFSGNQYGIYDSGTNASSPQKMFIRNSVFETNSTAGITSAQTTSPPRIQIENNIFYGNATGISVAFATLAAVDQLSINKNNAYGSNSTADRSGISAGTNDVALSADPFTAKGAGLDWSLNTTAGGGAALRSVGFPGLLQGTSTTGYPDIGAVRHADPRCSSFANCTAGNIKNGVTIDDVTGTFVGTGGATSHTWIQ